MSTPSPDAWLRRQPGVFHRRFGGEVILLARGEPELRRLAGPAAATWLALEEPLRFGALVDAAIDSVGSMGVTVDASALTDEVARAVTALRDVGVVAVEGPGDDREDRP